MPDISRHVAPQRIHRRARHGYPSRPARFDTGHTSRVHDLAFLALDRRVQLFSGRHLRRGQAIRRIAGLAQQRGWIELARVRVVDDVVFDAVVRIARGHHGVGEQRHLV